MKANTPGATTGMIRSKHYLLAFHYFKINPLFPKVVSAAGKSVQLQGQDFISLASVWIIINEDPLLDVETRSFCSITRYKADENSCITTQRE